MIWECSHQKLDSITEQFQEMEHLTIYSVDAKSAIGRL